MSFWQFGGANDWNTFRAAHKGQGYTAAQLSKMYRQQQKTSGKKVAGPAWEYSGAYKKSPAKKARKSPAKKAAKKSPAKKTVKRQSPTSKARKSASKKVVWTESKAYAGKAKKGRKSAVKYGPKTRCASHYPPCPSGCMRGATGKACRKKGAGRPKFQYSKLYSGKNQKGGSLSFSAAQRILQNYMRARYGAL